MTGSLCCIEAARAWATSISFATGAGTGRGGGKGGGAAGTRGGPGGRSPEEDGGGPGGRGLEEDAKDAPAASISGFTVGRALLDHDRNDLEGLKSCQMSTARDFQP